MTTEVDVVPVQSLPLDLVTEGRLVEAADAPESAQAINARRALAENPATLRLVRAL